MLLALAGVELASYLLIALANPFLVSPILRRATLYRDQTDAITRFLAGDRDIWIFDSTLGWSTTPSRRLGNRASYPETPPPGVVRVAAFGNSFLRGADVAPGSAWLGQMEDSFPNLEVLNFGVAAYGNDQSYLQYLRDGRPRHAGIVLIGVAPDNLRRNVNVYRRFLTTHGPPLTKPRFLLDSAGALALVPNPLRRDEDLRRYLEHPDGVAEWGRHDQFYEPLVYENGLYDWSAAVRLTLSGWVRIRNAVSRESIERGGVVNTSAGAYRLALALLRRFVAQVKEDGAVPIVLIMPDLASLQRAQRGRRGTLGPLADALRADSVEVLDLTEPLLAEAGEGGDVRTLLTPGLHYSVPASTRIALWLGPRLVAHR